MVMNIETIRKTMTTEKPIDLDIPEEEISDKERILRRAKKAEKAYRDGDVKIGSFEDFWKDMND
jgi:hypothetical protein